ncbi:MAG TPA: protein kinase [Gemmataceae bacterium]|nr:protein kinase [Gemmataceae bacterium]
MTPAVGCPEPQILKQFVLGQLAEAVAARVEGHILGCETCLLTLRGHRPDDPLVQAMQAAATQREPAELPVEKLDALLRNVKQRVAQVQHTPGRTPAVVSGETDPETTQLFRDVLAPPQAPGELGWIGAYRILEVLGTGGMGVVYQAEDTVLKRTVALKVMTPQAAARPAARERFLREAQAAAALEHEHIITIYQVGEQRGVPFLAMPCLKGESLEARLRRDGPLPVPEVLRLGRQIALGLAAAHAKGLIHRDVKPANIWLEAGSGRVKILDFGLARPFEDDAHLTDSGMIIGTPAYMAPEQARGEEMGPRGDLFSLGIVLYRICTGELPFRGNHSLGVLTALATQTPRPLRELNPAVPPALAELVMQLLAKEPTERPASAREVADRLQALERSHPGPPSSPTAVLPPTVATRSRERSTGWRRGLLVGLLALAVLLPLGYFFGPWRNPSIDNKGSFNGHIKGPKEKDRGTEPPAKNVAPPDKRKAAEWALSRNPGGITVRVKNKKPVTIRAVQDFPKEEFELAGTLDLQGPQVGDDDLERHYASLTQLASLNLYGTKVSSAGLVHLKGLTQLIGLNLCGTRVGDDGLAHLRGLTNLQELALADTEVGDAGLIHLKGLTQLVDLHLGRTQITDVGLSRLQGLTRLTKLNLCQTRLRGSGLAHLKGLKQLQYLVLSDTHCDGAALVHLRGLIELLHLDLDGLNLNDASLEYLKPLTKLGFLSLARTPIGSAGLAHLGGLTGLASLQLSATQVDDAGLVHLKGLANLQGLLLDDTPIRGTGLASLKELPRLSSLHLGCPKLTDESLKSLRELKQLAFLSLAGSGVSDAALKHLSGLPGLRSLDLRRTRFTAAGVAALRNALPECNIRADVGKK